ncbi:MAG: NAD(P)H-dependent oxidoreductase [Terricaulis sp.]|nr:NAD(P)H-dependent oxidoreductase [Terricaulis sp.]
MSKILVIDAHPDPNPALGHALAEAYAHGARASGHEVRLLRLADLQLTFLRSSAEFASPPIDPGLVAAREDISWAQHITLLFPLWLGGAPALLHAFLEHAGRASFFAEVDHSKGWRSKLEGRSARLIVTMGGPALLYRLWFGGFGVRALARSVLRLAGIGPVRMTYFGGAAKADAPHARRLETVRELGRRAA